MAKTSLAERMSRLQEQKARLANDEAKLKADLSKHLTRRRVEAGMLVEQAGLLDLDEKTLYGALLSLAEVRDDPNRIASWAERGRLVFARRQEKNDLGREPLTVTFPSPLPTAFATRLRAAGLRFNKLLDHWQGLADHAIVETLAREQNGNVTRLRGNGPGGSDSDVAATDLFSSAPRQEAETP